MFLTLPQRKSIPPEFEGIWHLHAESKMLVARLIVFLAILATCFLGVSMIGYNAQYERMRYLMEAGEHVHCPEEAIAKIVENGKVTCVMKLLAPGDRTQRILPYWWDKKSPNYLGKKK